MDNMIGKMLDNRYELLEVIGSGGMAMVYKAKDHRLNRPVAVKILKSDLAEDADFRRRFRDESQAVAMLSHPNIVSVYDVSHGEIEYIVMELIDGITLKQYMERRGQLNWREALHFITQIMKGISHAHSRGIIHRDIKPQNIMVLRDGSVKVADFGIACLSNSAQTMTQQALGSVHYISPEQAKGERTDVRSDVYSAGVVLYEMLCNRLPFEGDSAVSVAIQHLSSVALPPREINPDVPKALELICMKAMANDIEKRYPSADAMLADLEEFRKNPDTDLNFTIKSLQTPVSEEATQPLPSVQSIPMHRNEPANSKAEPEEKPVIPKWLIYTGIALVSVAVIFALFHMIFGSFDKEPEPTEFEVPSLLGMTLDEARADSRIDGIFTIEQIGQRSDDEYAAGEIVEQSPIAKSVVKGNRVISVLISTGVKTDVMPPLIGQEHRTGVIQLKNLDMNLEIQHTEQYSDDIAMGCIMETIPAAGGTLKAGETVVLVVSKGSDTKPIPVPTFLNIDINTVKQQLTDLNLVIGEVTHANSETVPEGCVIQQSIAPKVEVTPGTKIDFIVSDGPIIPEPPEPSQEEQPPEGEQPSGDEPVDPAPAETGDTGEQQP
ncbi:MAG: Stk1 family PASTA domain-containing Ser/Thr kinase [Oscillospiraceae bacterium]|nr:Stk1 family PASTA domain-containing Ser/Thr kinase [Oscillospiraceae bacterium]MBQ2323646.1 Stk1 family PASTA domain-containing Ser/Thr kinase [Oscillospiraceae bacterium]MBQ5442192.1 Stk1 family PASTA domain-containing Ser/Thr kinase [Oscillospiraceae bacterium]